MHQVILLARFALLAIFAFAAIHKLRDRERVALGLVDFRVPARLAPAAAILLVASEIAVTVALLFDRTAFAGALGAVVLLVVFTSVVAANLARGNRPACNCFGADDRHPIGWDTLLRNAGLIALAAFVTAYVSDAPVLSTVRESTDAMRAHPLAALVMSACVATIGLVAFALWHVLRQQGRIMLRLDALESSLSPFEEVAPPQMAVRGLPIGTEAPDFSLPTIDGANESLEGLGALERPVLLVFVNPKCGPCQALLPELARWQTDYAASLSIVLVSEGSAEENRSKALPGLTYILLQEEREIATAYQAFGTPAAVLVEDGLIASGVAQGADEIRDLVADFFDGRPQPVLAPGSALPDVTVALGSGDTVSLRDIVAGTSSALAAAEPADEETVLLFWNPGCGFCAQMLDDLRAWEAERDGAHTRLVFVSNAPLGEAADGIRSLVVVDAETRAAAAFGAGGTPMAVRVNAHGLVASRVVAGREAVLALLTARRERAALTQAG
jgi:thiol-disulfide isomerase/thioredoxin